MTAGSITRRRQHERWLQDLTVIPTAAGHEDRVMSWVTRWVRARRDLRVRRDRAGNLTISRRSDTRGRSVPAPLFITAHLDHPAFVVRAIVDERTIALEFRGGVDAPYFEHAPITLFDSRNKVLPGTIVAIEQEAKPFPRFIARLAARSTTLRVGDIGRWRFEGDGRVPRIADGRLYTHACDDLAAVAAALAMLDTLRARRNAAHVSVLLTRAEEVGFIGAIAACKARTVPAHARLICLENSRSFADSPIGGGPIVRVGDRSSVFPPSLTNRISVIAAEHAQQQPAFRWQRKLMAGGSCEATAFAAYGYKSTCLCLALGNYHNMVDIDGVRRGERPAHVGPEFISTDDYHGLIELLVVSALELDAVAVSPRRRMETLFAAHQHVL